ncbi:MAG: hypothetical protein H6747_13050 [Deltaproteobacteria bacterium]|nr:hypothetical protein [Deltaproteobacteria bacterium]
MKRGRTLTPALSALTVALVASSALVASCALAAATPDCLPRAAASALAGLGRDVDGRAIARALPMHRDGADVFDLHQWLRAQGVGVLALAPDLPVLEALGAGGAELIVVRRVLADPQAAAASPAHAVHASRRGAPSGSARVVDPNAGAPYVQPWPQALAQTHVALWLYGSAASGPGRLPTALRGRLHREDAAFVATGWLRRAAELPGDAGADADRWALLERAMAASPWLPAVRWAVLRALLPMRRDLAFEARARRWPYWPSSDER